MVWVEIQSLAESFDCATRVVRLTALHIDETKLIVSISIVLVVPETNLEVLGCLFLVTLVVVGGGQVKVALG